MYYYVKSPSRACQVLEGLHKTRNLFDLVKYLRELLLIRKSLNELPLVSLQMILRFEV